MHVCLSCGVMERLRSNSSFVVLGVLLHLKVRAVYQVVAARRVRARSQRRVKLLSGLLSELRVQASVVGQSGSMASEINPLNQLPADGSGLTGLMKQKTCQFVFSLKVVVCVSMCLCVCMCVCVCV